MEMWILEVDPNGNTSATLTTTVSWNEVELGAVENGTWVIREGKGDSGPVRIANMMTNTSFSVTDVNTKFFTIISPPLTTRIESRDDMQSMPKDFASTESSQRCSHQSPNQT
jgi:hypothetical protein